MSPEHRTGTEFIAQIIDDFMNNRDTDVAVALGNSAKITAEVSLVILGTHGSWHLKRFLEFVRDNAS